MSRHIDLGRVEASHAVFRADLDIILRSNLLVQANSGGGKSWALRRMIEQAFGKVPQIVIDPEGEFSTLRQKFDLILVGKGGDTPADIRSAQLLAHRLLELGASAVVDLFEMSKTQRPVWVAAFVQALVDAPKKLWRDLLLYVDEAHELAPEAGHGAHESAAEKTCRHALIDFAAKGRKRGYGVVAATQRLGKLSKDFAAELKNVMIGQTFIDIDRERAAGSLGIAKADRAQFFINVKTLAPGSFYALGRALLLEPTLVRIGSVLTEHPEAGRRQSAPPPPTEKIRHLLPQLADLPKEAETKAQTEKELKARIVELERSLSVRTAVAVNTQPQIVEKSVLKPGDLVRIERVVERLFKSREAYAEVLMDGSKRVAEADESVVAELKTLTALLKPSAQPTPQTHPNTITQLTKGLGFDLRRPHVESGRPRFVDPGRGPRQAVVLKNVPDTGIKYEGEIVLPEKSQRMLGALRQNEAMGRMTMPFRNVAIIAGVSPNSGTTRNRKAQLTGGGFISTNGDSVMLTDAGRKYPLNVELPPDDVDGLLAFWEREIGTEKIAKMLRHVVHHGPCSDGELAEAAGMELSGTYRNYKAALTGRGLIEKHGDAYVATEVFRR